MRKSVCHILLLVLIALLFSCRDQNEDSSILGTGVPVLLSVKIAGVNSSSPTARSLTEFEDQEVTTVDVLAFEKSGTDYLFSYLVSGRIQSITAGVCTIRVVLEEHAFEQKLILIANARSEVQAAGILMGENLNTARTKLIFQQTNEWEANNNNSGSKPAIPMYGETNPIQITESTTQLGSYNLLRMLARIDVTTRSTVANFQLVNASIFNRKDRGYIGFKEDNWNSAEQSVTAPDVPESAQTIKLNTLFYNADATNQDIKRSIYTFEATKPANRKEATSIIVGGYYDYPTNQTTLSYYRVDIPNYVEGVLQPNTMGDILRNHLYTIDIQAVAKEGYPTPEEAFDGIINITTNVVPWNLAIMDDISYHDIYSLKVSRAVFNYLAVGATNQQLTVLTDYDEGWKGTLIPATATSWIQFQGGTASLSGTANSSKTLIFDISSNNTGESRHAILKIKAGGLTKYVDIYQTNLLGNVLNWIEYSDADAINGPYRLGVSRTTYVMAKDQLSDLPLVISTDYPTGWVAQVTAGSSWINITANANSALPDTKTLLFSLAENNTKVDRLGTITIQAGNLKKQIYISQSMSSNTSNTLNLTPWNTTSGFESGTSINGPFSLSVSKTAYSLMKNEQLNIPLAILTDNQWAASVQTGTEWITITNNATGAVAGTILFKVAENDTKLNRSGTLVVQSGNLKKVVTINQNVSAIVGATSSIIDWDTTSGFDTGTSIDGPFSLSVSKTAYSLMKNEQLNIPLAILTDNQWAASVQTGTDWITITNNATGAVAGTILFKVAENNSKLNRSGTLVVQSGNLKKVVTINQNVSAIAGATSSIIDWETNSGFETETPINGPNSLILSRTQYRYDGMGTKNRTIQVTATGGGTWTAKTTTPWITLVTDFGVANNTPSSLIYSINSYASGSDRTGTITLTMGNVVKDIAITQYAGAAISITNLAAQYILEDRLIQKFTLSATAPWIATVATDPNNMIQQLRSSSGIQNTTGSDFLFTLKTQTGGPFRATIQISSPDQEFDPYFIELSGIAYYDLGGVYVYPVDQSYSQTWYLYSNTPEGTNELSVPPISGTQASPARINSCANLPSISGKPWRLPTETELIAIYTGAVAAGGIANFGFTTNASEYYWSATSSSTNLAYIVRFTTGARLGSSKTILTHHARCVRNK